MGVVIDMPAAMVQEANEYAERNGCSFRDLLCLSVEMYLAEQARKRKTEVSAWTEKFNALLDSTESRNDDYQKHDPPAAVISETVVVAAAHTAAIHRHGIRHTAVSYTCRTDQHCGRDAPAVFFTESPC